MNLQQKKNGENLVLEIINTMDEYYDCSFRIRNDSCFVILIKLIEQLEELLGLVKNTEQQLEIKDVLNHIANAMAGKDYVMIRDLLHYQLRSKINNFSSLQN